MQSLRTPIPARHTPPLLAANPAPRPLASCKVCVPIIMVLRDYYPKVCENFAASMQQEGTTITFTFTIGGTFSVQAAFQRVVGRPRPR